MKRVIVDTETTGFHPPEAGIVEVAAIVLDDEKTVAAFTEICHPGSIALCGPGVDQALSISGIKRSELAKAATSADVARRLRDFIRQHALGVPFHAFNVAFDSRFLAAAPWSIPVARWGECIMEAAMREMGPAGALPAFSGGKFKWPKLSEAAKFYHVDQKDAHRALGDAKAASAVYVQILEHRAAKQEQEQASANT